MASDPAIRYHSSRVQRLKLLAPLRGGEGDDALLSEYERLAGILLKKLGHDMSQKRDAARSRRQIRQSHRGANVTFDPGRSPHLLMVLTVRDPGGRVVPIPRTSPV